MHKLAVIYWEQAIDKEQKLMLFRQTRLRNYFLCLPQRLRKVINRVPNVCAV